MTDLFYKFTEVLPSGQDNEKRGGEVHEEEEGEIEHWSEEEWGKEWEQWEFVGDDDVKEDQEYEEDEEDDEEEEDKEEEEEKGEGGANVPTDLCMVCVTTPCNASIIHGDTGHRVCCFECASRLKTDKKEMSCVPQKIKLVMKNLF